MSAEHWGIAILLASAVADTLAFWVVMANYRRRLNQLEQLVMAQDYTRRAYESEMRVAERRRVQP